jgi:hypothetical protein
MSIARRLLWIETAALTGCVALIVATPFWRMARIRYALDRARNYLAIQQPAYAVQDLCRMRPWAGDFPEIRWEVEQNLIVALVRAGALDRALTVAEDVRAGKQVSYGPDVPALRHVAHRLEILANRFYFKLRWNPVDSSPGDPQRGFSVISEELERIDRLDLLPAPGADPNPSGELFAPPVGHPNPRSAEADPETSGQRVRQIAAVPATMEVPASPNSHDSATAPIAQAASNAHASDPVQQAGLMQNGTSRSWRLVALVTSPTPARIGGDVANLADSADHHALAVTNGEILLTKDQLTTRLRAQADTLQREIAVREKAEEQAPAVARTDEYRRAAHRYNATKAKYNEFIEQNAALKTKMDRATGAQRNRLLDELRARRAQESPLQNEFSRAKAQFEMLAPEHQAAMDRAADLKAMRDELRDLRRQLQELERAP